MHTRMGMNLEKYEKPGQKIQQNTKIGDPSTIFSYLHATTSTSPKRTLSNLFNDSLFQMSYTSAYGW